MGQDQDKQATGNTKQEQNKNETSNSVNETSQKRRAFERYRKLEGGLVKFQKRRKKKKINDEAGKDEFQ